jgi:hypothetical protein
MVMITFKIIDIQTELLYIPLEKKPLIKKSNKAVLRHSEITFGGQRFHFSGLKWFF